jgi:hypothetical protein
MSRYNWDRLQQLKPGQLVPADLYDALQVAADLEATAMQRRPVHVSLRPERRAPVLVAA